MSRLKGRIIALLLLSGVLAGINVLFATPAYAQVITPQNPHANNGQPECSEIIDDSVTWLSTYNLTVLDHLQSVNQVEGKVIVDADFLDTDSLDIGTRLTGPTNACTGTTLTVVGRREGGGDLGGVVVGAVAVEVPLVGRDGPVGV